MKLINKITATLIPDTQQRAFLGGENVELTIDVLKFKDGSIRVTLPDFKPEAQHRYLRIEAFCESLDDLMVVSQIKEITDRLSKTPRITSLKILSTMYTRYDRPMFENGIDGFGAKCFTQFVNSMGFSVIDVLDCHSNVTTDLLNMGFSSVKQLHLAASTIDTSVLGVNIVAPDKGAVVKNEYAKIICNKVRNPETGEITGMEILQDSVTIPERKFLVVDDICEGGRTFIEVAKLLEEKYPNSERELYITHGIFANNAVPKLLEKYSRVNVYIMKKSVYDSLHELEKSKLSVKFLVNA